jgi:acetolactate synthase-1/2/3 large subunit
MTKMTAGRAVVEALIAQGVDTVFGIISIHTLHVYDALRDAEEAGRIRFVGARHEHALGFMADGYARVTGKPGVMLTSGGPGAADSVGAMGESYHSSVPLLQITAEIESEWVSSGRGVTHEAKNQMTMFESVTGWRAVASSPQDVPNQIAAAFDHLRSEHPRPAVLAVPTDYFAKNADMEIMPARAPRTANPDHALLEQAAKLLSGAKRPMIIAGAGTMGAAAELRTLAERYGIPVAAADGGKGAFPEDHPLSLGTVLGGRVWLDNPVQDYASTCDVVIAVGTSLPYRSTSGVGLQLPEQLIHVDIDPSMFGRNYPAKVGIAGDAQAVLGGLLEGLDCMSPPPGREAEIAALKADSRASLKAQFPNELRAWEAIRASIDRDAIVLCDSTIPGYTGTRCFQALEPRSYHHPHGWVSIGYSFAASLGAKVAAPDRQVVCVTGDGGFQYNIQELASAAQYGIAPVVLVFNDNAWGVLQRYQKTQFGERYFATALQNPDFGQLAGAYGADYTRVDSSDALGAALRDIGKPSRLHLVEIAMPDGFGNLP